VLIVTAPRQYFKFIDSSRRQRPHDTHEKLPRLVDLGCHIVPFLTWKINVLVAEVVDEVLQDRPLQGNVAEGVAEDFPAQWFLKVYETYVIREPLADCASESMRQKAVCENVCFEEYHEELFSEAGVVAVFALEVDVPFLVVGFVRGDLVRVEPLQEYIDYYREVSDLSTS